MENIVRSVAYLYNYLTGNHKVKCMNCGIEYTPVNQDRSFEKGKEYYLCSEGCFISYMSNQELM